MKKIAFVLAHPDDAEIWCGGFLLKELNSSTDIRIYYLYACSKDRINESNINSKKYGYEIYYIENKREKLFDYLLDYNPDYIITHWEFDTNFEHRKTNEYLNLIIPNLIFSNKMNFKLFCCEPVNLIGINNNFFNPDFYIDISKYKKEKNEMINTYKSQNPTYWKQLVDIQDKLFGNISGCKYCEGYKQMTILGVKKCLRMSLE